MNFQDELCAPPEVCGAHADEAKEVHLSKHLSSNANDNIIQRTIRRDKPLLCAIAAIVICLNIRYLQYVLYPFMIFSTWVHEMCHGLAAILTGGGVKELFVYKDGSGLAYTWTTGENWKRAFVASGGYVGTALLGGLLLLLRRTHRGPTIGLIFMAFCILLSVAMYVRNGFAIGILITMAVILLICAWKLKARLVAYLYSFLAATCSFNAFTSIKQLFAPGQGYVNGQPVYSDAHTVAEYAGGTYVMWATIWMIFAIVMSTIGLVFALDGHTYKKGQKQQQQSQASGDYYMHTQDQQQSAPQVQVQSNSEVPLATVIDVTPY